MLTLDYLRDDFKLKNPAARRMKFRISIDDYRAAARSLKESGDASYSDIEVPTPFEDGSKPF